jgi:hypothetical protein
MQAIRQIVETEELRKLCDIPEGFSAETVEVIIFPIFPKNSGKVHFNADHFFRASKLKNVAQMLESMRDEWEK